MGKAKPPGQPAAQLPLPSAAGPGVGAPDPSDAGAAADAPPCLPSGRGTAARLGRSTPPPSATSPPARPPSA
eukprot:gene10496-55699_t